MALVDILLSLLLLLTFLSFSLNIPKKIIPNFTKIKKEFFSKKLEHDLSLEKLNKLKCSEDNLQSSILLRRCRDDNYEITYLEQK